METDHHAGDGLTDNETLQVIACEQQPAPVAVADGAAPVVVIRFEIGAQARGAEDVFLEVAADNKAARALYASAGYQEAGHRKSYYNGPKGQKVDALVLRKKLIPSNGA